MLDNIPNSEIESANIALTLAITVFMKNMSATQWFHGDFL
ncbi:hypothetical protein SPONN_882 [uncultured Candidatus Thioglobus sp.]|nr:hypothetical protein SPONL_997 [uncultured Candidatus Thioglobus sp.]SMN02353.1 hypothetical protein SPONN_882 [uncultured Candidatus Thioglobus sp.]